MTYVMLRSYGFTGNGRGKFILNRFLRLYPSYWFLLIVSMLAIVIVGSNVSTAFKNTLFLPNSLTDLFQNLTMVYFNWFPHMVVPRLSPPTWALTVELFYYALICIGISKGMKRTVIWFCVSVFYFSLTHFMGLDQTYRYHHIIAGSLPFSIGALIYHYQPTLTSIFDRYLPKVGFKLLLVAFALNAMVGAFGEKFDHSLLINASYYFNYLINAWVIIVLIDGKGTFISKRSDDEIGKFSYPIYIFHWQAGLISAVLFWDNQLLTGHLDRILLTLSAIAISVIVSFVSIRFIEKPIESLRLRIKRSQ